MLNELAKRVWLQSVSEAQSGEHKSGELAFQTDFALRRDVPQSASLDVPQPAKRQMHLWSFC